MKRAHVQPWHRVDSTYVQARAYAYVYAWGSRWRRTRHMPARFHNLLPPSHTLETPLHPTVPRLRAAIFSPRETFRPHFTGGRNKAGSFFVVDRNRQLRFWFMTVHLIPIGIWKMLRKEFYYSFVSNYLNLNLILLTRKKFVLISFNLNSINNII